MVVPLIGPVLAVTRQILGRALFEALAAEGGAVRSVLQVNRSARGLASAAYKGDAAGAADALAGVRGAGTNQFTPATTRKVAELARKGDTAGAERVIHGAVRASVRREIHGLENGSTFGERVDVAGRLDDMTSTALRAMQGDKTLSVTKAARSAVTPNMSVSVKGARVTGQEARNVLEGMKRRNQMVDRLKNATMSTLQQQVPLFRYVGLTRDPAGAWLDSLGVEWTAADLETIGEEMGKGSVRMYLTRLSKIGNGLGQAARKAQEDALLEGNLRGASNFASGRYSDYRKRGIFTSFENANWGGASDRLIRDLSEAIEKMTPSRLRDFILYAVSDPWELFSSDTNVVGMNLIKIAASAGLEFTEEIPEPNNPGKTITVSKYSDFDSKNPYVQGRINQVNTHRARVQAARDDVAKMRKERRSLYKSWKSESDPVKKTLARSEWVDAGKTLREAEGILSDALEDR